MIITAPPMSAQRNWSTTQNVNPPSDKTPPPRSMGIGQSTSKMMVRTMEPMTAILTWKDNFASVSASSLGGSTSSTSGILSLSISHLKVLSGNAKEPTTAMRVPPQIAQRFPTTQGQSDIMLP